jgi:hypothetical protein
MAAMLGAKPVADHPHRFGAFAILPLPDVEGAIHAAEYALDTLKLDGICLLFHVAGRHVGQPEEDELYAELNRRNAVVFIHPLRNQATNMPAYNYPSVRYPKKGPMQLIKFSWLSVFVAINVAYA